MHRALSSLLAVALSAFATASLLGAADAKPAATDPKVVKLKELTETIAAHKGKFVVVDFWGEFCNLCKEEFPNVVKLHQKYGKDGKPVGRFVGDAEETEKLLKKLLGK